MANDRKTGRGKTGRGKPGPDDAEQGGAEEGKTLRTKSGIVMEDVGEVELTLQEDHDIEDMIDQAEQDIDDVRVNFRWGSEQLALIKQVARKLGVPYQTYMKMVLYRNAVEDLKSFK